MVLRYILLTTSSKIFLSVSVQVWLLCHMTLKKLNDCDDLSSEQELLMFCFVDQVAMKVVVKSSDMDYLSIPGHPTPLPLEVALTILANNGPTVPQIIQMLEWQERSDSYIMILERPSPCEDLFDFLERHRGTLSEDVARHIMRQVVQAAHMCCQRGVLHRDIKLENLLINKETLEVKLIDFGCGDLLKTSAYTTFCGMYCPSSLQFEILILQLHILNSISFLTVTNEENLLFSGTEDYCPPEFRSSGRYHGKAATVWSLGVLLYELLCGEPPKHSDLDMTDERTWIKSGLSKGELAIYYSRESQL
nr:serine/threonine-protein kinase pim-1-like isoform X1 [Danio rerio]|eukprot:XP_021332684.1 serine/threonine-protein kinase pim-1-like isoform X1 [Danio rerio]